MSSDLLWTLIALQIVLGGFDTLFHHEFTERLAWRASQRHELQLHAVRNGIYAFLFLTLGWFEMHGTWALVVLALLAVEIVITLLDFVEEDVSRKLPASERITHTLLAINYGGVLVLAVPVLLAWSALPTSLVGTFYGWWSVLATFAALGVTVFALRDALASQRCLRLERRPAAPLMAALPPVQTVLVTGATGFIGRRLVEALVAGGHRVIALVRDPSPPSLTARPLSLVTSLDQVATDTRIDAIVNLAGEPIANAPWTKAKRARIIGSRVETTEAIVSLIARLAVKPSVLVSGSAIGCYGLWGDEPLDETSPARDCFSHDLCAAWESAARKAEDHGVRVVLLRIGLVLGTEGGMLGRFLTPFEFGLGGPIGSGRQWMSWIDRDDLVRLISHALASDDISGPLNATAPDPVTNAAFTVALAHALQRPAFLPLPAALLSLVGGNLARELMLGGQRVLPKAALASGFVFGHPTLAGALEAVLGTARAAGSDRRSAIARLASSSARPMARR
jgi:uncharacterized protein